MPGLDFNRCLDAFCRHERRHGGRMACRMPLHSNFGRVLDLSPDGARTRLGWRGLFWWRGKKVKLRFSGRDGKIEVGARLVSISRRGATCEGRFALVQVGDRQRALLRHLAGLLIVPGAVHELKYGGGRGR